MRLFERLFGAKQPPQIPPRMRLDLEVRRPLGQAHAKWCAALNDLRDARGYPRAAVPQCEMMPEVIELYARAQLHDAVARAADDSRSGIAAFVIHQVEAHNDRSMRVAVEQAWARL